MTAPSSASLPARPFPRLFEPLRIGSVTLRNRIVSSGHLTVMGVDGLVTDQPIAYQAARAATSASRRLVASTTSTGRRPPADRHRRPAVQGPLTAGDGAPPHVALQDFGSEASPYSRPVSVKSGGSGEATGDAASIWPGSLGAEALQTLSPCTMVP